jgi:hypothetical protein
LPQNHTPMASPLILLQNLFRRIATEQRQLHAIRLKSGAVDRWEKHTPGAPRFSPYRYRDAVS